MKFSPLAYLVALKYATLPDFSTSGTHNLGQFQPAHFFFFDVGVDALKFCDPAGEDGVVIFACADLGFELCLLGFECCDFSLQRFVFALLLKRKLADGIVAALVFGLRWGGNGGCAWRPARLLADDFCWKFCDDGALQLDFALGAGAYATALLAEIVQYEQGMQQGI